MVRQQDDQSETGMLAGVLFLAGSIAMALAVRQERLMQRHRQPGVSYRDVTLRRDGGWRRGDLFTPAGLHHQRHASRFGLIGAVLWVAALLALAIPGWFGR